MWLCQTQQHGIILVLCFKQDQVSKTSSVALMFEPEENTLTCSPQFLRCTQKKGSLWKIHVSPLLRAPRLHPMVLQKTFSVQQQVLVALLSLLCLKQDLLTVIANMITKMLADVLLNNFLCLNCYVILHKRLYIEWSC